MPIKANQTFTSTVQGWFVPDATMQDILRRLAIKDINETSK